MGMMATELYDALLSAKADEPKARAAAEAMALAEKSSNDQFLSLRDDIQKLRIEMEKFRGEMTLIRWMLGIVIATNIAILLRIFSA